MINDLLSVFPGLFDVLGLSALGGATWLGLIWHEKHTTHREDKETK